MTYPSGEEGRWAEDLQQWAVITYSVASEYIITQCIVKKVHNL